MENHYHTSVGPFSPHLKPKAGRHRGQDDVYLFEDTQKPQTLWSPLSLSISPHSPLGSQVATRVPGGRGRRGTDAFVVILHLQTDGPAQPPGDVQQPLHNEFIFFLPQRNQPDEPRKAPQKPVPCWGIKDSILMCPSQLCPDCVNRM